MTWARYHLTEMGGLQEIVAVLRRHYPTIQEIVVNHDAKNLGLILDVREKDYGVWEWNDEIIEDKSF